MDETVPEDGSSTIWGLESKKKVIKKVYIWKLFYYRKCETEADMDQHVVHANSWTSKAPMNLAIRMVMIRITLLTR